MALRLYTLLYYLITPMILLRLYWRGRKAPAYRRRIAERFGFFRAPGFQRCLWVHAVSVGETIAAAPLVKQLQQRYPELPIVVTTMTPTGSERVTALFGDSVFHVYAPYDLPGCLQRFINRLNPCLLIIMETELWPNTVNACARRNIPVILANARLSEKSAKGYQRFAALTAYMLQSLTRVAAQASADAERFKRLGLSAKQLAVTGSIKFDISLDESLRQQASNLRGQWETEGPRLIWIAASTHQGEEEQLLAAYKVLKKAFPPLLLVLVPRHPERFEEVTQLVTHLGLNGLKRSSGQMPSAAVEVYVADTMGEMLLLLGASDIAFVGGSLISRGGHNMLEPAAWGLPIITGESDYNFLAVSERLQAAAGLIKVADEVAMVEQMRLLLNSQERRKQQGQAALAVVKANRGALTALLALIDQQLSEKSVSVA